MSFKCGCRYLFMREYIDNIIEEYRVIIYEGKITYIEQYLVNYDERYMDVQKAKAMKQNLIEYVNSNILPKLHYKDATLDIARIDIDKEQLNTIAIAKKQFLIIEVNTPPYLFAGLGLCDIATEPTLVYTHKANNYIPFRYMSIYNSIDEV